MPINKKIFYLCIAVALALCMAQITGSSMLILAVLAAFLGLTAWACVSNYTLPFLLFFLPWSQLLKLNPTSFSFFTFAIVMVCFISVIKKKMLFKRYHVLIGFALVALTLLVKLIDGSGISFAYMAFMMLIVLFPVVKEEWKAQSYDFYVTVIFFSLGIIIAALCAQQLTGYGNISRYIRVDSYQSVRRTCGFYSDPNFYTAQITAAAAGALALILRERNKKHTITLAVIIVFLVYCGMLSGSKSFVVVLACVLLLWFVELIRVRGRAGLKTFLLIFVALAVIYIASSALFSGLIEVLMTRFSVSSNLSDLTTGRTALWDSYLRELYSNPKLLFLGNGFTNVKLNGRASHNTIIQMLFQLGFVGSVFLAAWSVCFFRGTFARTLFSSRNCVAALLVMTGAFMPWLAIDILYFDEFFLLQWYVFTALQYLSGDSKKAHPALDSSAEKPAAGRRKRKVRVVWGG